MQLNGIHSFLVLALVLLIQNQAFSQLGQSRQAYDQVLGQPDGTRTEGTDRETVKYKLSNGNDVEVAFVNDKSRSIVVTGRSIRPDQVCEIIQQVIPFSQTDPRKIPDGESWMVDKSQSKLFPSVSTETARSRFVQTGTKIRSEGGETYLRIRVTYLNGVKINEEPLGYWNSPSYLTVAPAGHNQKYIAEIGVERAILVRRDQTAYATCDSTYDSDWDTACTGRVVVCEPEAYFEMAFANLATSTTPSSVRSYAPYSQMISYDAAIASMVPEGELQKIISDQYFGLLIAAIGNEHVPLESIANKIQRVPADKLTNAMTAKFSSRPTWEKIRRITVLGSLQTQRADRALERLQRDKDAGQYATAMLGNQN